MSGFIHFLKTIFVPLFLALILYLFLVHLLIPFVRRHRTHYTAYLPLPSGVAQTTLTWRTRVSDALYNLFMPGSWLRWRGQNRVVVVDGSTSHEEEDMFDEEEGEGMVGFDPIDERRREALDQRRSLMEEERRLGRELEEGFRDDSDDEAEDERRRSLSRHR